MATKWVATVTGQHWHVAKIRTRGSKVKILKVYSFDLEESMEIQYGEDLKQKVERAGRELESTLKAYDIPSKNLTLALSYPGVITRIVTVPAMKKKLLDTLFTEQVDQYFTLNVADYIIDYKVLTQVEKEGQKRYQVLLVAFPKDIWELQLDVLQAAKVKPRTIDVQFECLTRMYTCLESVDSAIINLSGNRAEIVLLEKGVFFLYSDVNFNASVFKNHISGEFPMESFPETSRESMIETMQESFPETKVTIEELENVFFPVMRNLEDFLDFFRTRHFGQNIQVIYLTGQFASVEGIDRVFERNLEIKTQVGYPTGWKSRLKFSRKVNNRDENMLGGLIGLALRED